ncbi:MAG: DsbA family protein [Solirubrobacterales bacterium]|nr:DsbA family protein [Solirubrobacterales bacterium]
MAAIEVTHFSDPGCPWAYSAAPHFAALRWRYGEQLRWRLVLIVLTEQARQYVERGYTPQRQAVGYRRFRDRGMPFATAPRERIAATAVACRAIIATRLSDPVREWEAFRALQFAWFTTTLVLDEPDAVAAALQRVAGLDVGRVMGMLDAPEVGAAYDEDRRLARTAAGSPTEFQGKSANTDGAVRFTAPSLVFAAAGRTLEAGGFQSLGAYDVCVANLDTSLARREAPEDVVDVLAALPEGLTTREVAACLAPDKSAPDDAAAEDRLIAAVAEGRATRETLGSGALWSAA